MFQLLTDESLAELLKLTQRTFRLRTSCMLMKHEL